MGSDFDYQDDINSEESEEEIDVKEEMAKISDDEFVWKLTKAMSTYITF